MGQPTEAEKKTLLSVLKKKHTNHTHTQKNHNKTQQLFYDEYDKSQWV